MVTIKEYKDLKIKQIEKLISIAGLQSFEVSDAAREMAKAYPELKNWAEKMSTWRDSILDAESLDVIDVYYNGYSSLVEKLMKKKHDKENQKRQDDAQADKEWWEDYYKNNTTNKEWLRKYLAGELDWQKDGKKRDEENKKKLDEHKENLKNDKRDFDEKNKKKYIGDIEMDLIKKNVSEERLNKKLGVSDWREKINGASDSWEALSRRTDLWDIIRDLKYNDNDKNDEGNEFTCASCGEKKTEYYNYPLEGGKKYCSVECWNKGEKKDDRKTTPIKYQENNFGFSSVSEFFTWMKKMGVKKIEFDFNTNQVIISCNGGKKLNASDSKSGLTTKQQQALTERFKSETEPITFSQVQGQLEGSKDKGGNGGIIATIVVVGILFAVIIGVVVYKSRKKNY